MVLKLCAPPLPVTLNFLKLWKLSQICSPFQQLILAFYLQKGIIWNSLNSKYIKVHNCTHVIQISICKYSLHKPNPSLMHVPLISTLLL